MVEEQISNNVCCQGKDPLCAEVSVCLMPPEPSEASNSDAIQVLALEIKEASERIANALYEIAWALKEGK